MSFMNEFQDLKKQGVSTIWKGHSQFMMAESTTSERGDLKSVEKISGLKKISGPRKLIAHVAAPLLLCPQ